MDNILEELDNITTRETRKRHRVQDPELPVKKRKLIPVSESPNFEFFLDSLKPEIIQTTELIQNDQISESGPESPKIKPEINPELEKKSNTPDTPSSPGWISFKGSSFSVYMDPEFWDTFQNGYGYERVKIITGSDFIPGFHLGIHWNLLFLGPECRGSAKVYTDSNFIGISKLLKHENSVLTTMRSAVIKAVGPTYTVEY